MSDRDEACWFCNPDLRTDRPPGGWLIDDRAWRASHVPPGYGPTGTVILETTRHVLDQSRFEDHEAASCAAVTGLLVEAIRDVTGCDRVYQWATMDAYAHFHVWLVPWSESAPLRGPRFLVDQLVDGGGCDEESALRTTEALRVALGAPA
jgi:hypothetical protein